MAKSLADSGFWRTTEVIQSELHRVNDISFHFTEHRHIPLCINLYTWYYVVKGDGIFDSYRWQEQRIYGKNQSRNMYTFCLWEGS